MQTNDKKFNNLRNKSYKSLYSNNNDTPIKIP